MLYYKQKICDKEGEQMTIDLALEKMIPGMQEIYGDMVDSIILYGSTARGTRAEDTDVDVAILLRAGATKAMRDQMLDLVVDLELECGRVLSVLCIDYDKFAKWKDYHFNLWSHQYVYKYKSPEIGKKLYQEYTANILKTEQDFQKRLQELEEYDNGRKKIYIVAKIFDQRGCLAYCCKTPNEARCLPGTLEALRADGVQIVILDSPEIYSEYAPYTYIEDMKEFIDKVAQLNRAA